MIKKITKLQDIGCFDQITQNPNFQCGGIKQNCNIIFGLNGTGKTTISNALSLFCNESFLGETEKKALFDDIKRKASALVELEFQDASKIKFPAQRVHSKNIFVFNSNFVLAHVFDGTKGKIKKFSNIGGELKNKEIVLLNDDIDALTKTAEILVAEQKKYDTEIDKITKEKSEEFRKSLTDKGKRLTTPKLQTAILPIGKIEDLEQNLVSLKNEYELSKKQDDLNLDINSLGEIHLRTFDIDIQAINQILSTTVQKLSGAVLEQQIQKIKELFEEEQDKQNVERWYKFGSKIINHRKPDIPYCCPICNTDISARIDEILNDFNGFFNRDYDEYITELEKKIEEIKTCIVWIKQNQLNVFNIEKLRSKYVGITNLQNEFVLPTEETENGLNKIQIALENKRSNIQHLEVIDELGGGKEYQEKIAEITDLSAKMRGILESKSLKTYKIEDEIREIFNASVLIEFNNLDKKSNNLKKYQDNSLLLTKIKEVELPSKRAELTKELAKIKAESRGISKYLKVMGVDNFTIDINDGKDENIVISYRDLSTGKMNLRNSLSEGEKTAVAFAYFLSKFENEVNTEDKIKDSTVIIDDPITSLDENRLYSTAYLIKNTFDSVKQLILLSHNFLFLKYFNSFYRGKAICFYLEKNSLVILPEELKNFESPYFYMLKSIQGFLDESNTKIVYNDAKRYLPNYIRRVLETFLSFRFAKIASNRGAGFSPGLADFLDIIPKTNLEEKTKDNLKNLVREVNHICDAHSHGNAHHTQESFFISESDLKTVTQKALEIIDILEGQKFSVT